MGIVIGRFQPYSIRILVLTLCVAVVCGQGWCLAAEPLSLQQALQLAIQHNPTLQSSREEVNISDAQKDMALAAFLPRIDATGTYTNTNQPSKAFGILLDQGRFTAADFAIPSLNNPGLTENFSSALRLTQPLYNGGRNLLNMEISDIGQTVSAEGLESTRQTVLFRVTQAYFNLALAKLSLAIAQETVQIAISNAKHIAIRYRDGVVVKSDLLQAKVRLASHRQDEIRAKQFVRVAKLTLRHTIGMNDAVDISETLRDAPATVPNLENLISTALESRPDYRQTIAQLRQADLAVDLAKSVYRPIVNLQANYELNNTAPFSPNGSNNYSVFGILSLNLFHGLGDAAAIRKAEARAEKARQLLEAKRRRIEVEVVDASSQFISASERLKVTDQAITQAEENLRIVRNRYNEGLASVLDLLTAELVLKQAKRNRMRALYDVRISQARMDFVTGTVQKGLE